ncbi:MAG: FAD-dependent oxidoreductase [Solobacterium sp.]|nr:FAD-dependent oxidoreductase [Solobacterium sp.]
MKLLEKGYLGTCQIRNRSVMTAMTTGYAGLDGAPTEQLTRYYEERAKGGVGLIVTEIFRVNNVHGVAFPRQMYALNPMNVQPLAQMTARVHQHGARIFAQIHHGGSTNVPEMNNGRIVAPSAVPNVSGIMPDPLTLEEIEELKQQFIGTAAACKAADFDGVEIHGAHGYLLCEFLSPAFNKREDQYGGSLENRCRLINEIVQGIKAVCGKDFPVGVRFSCDEHDPFHEDSLKLPDGIEIAKCLEAGGADFLDVSNGNYFCPHSENEEPYSYAQGCREAETKAIKDAVSIPVIGVSNIKSPAVAEKLLEDGACDFVGVGRQHIADPEWIKKTAAGRTDDIAHCIGCLYCFESLMTVGYVRCSVNPKAGREGIFHEPPAKDGNGRKVAVVGGGVAGMEAAAVLGQRGFDVTLYEKDSKLGGEVNLACATAPYKDKVGWLVTTLANAMEKGNVKVCLNTEATPDLVKENAPEAVFLAVGGKPIIPPLPGTEKAVLAADVIRGTKKITGKTVIIGGGLTGLETAEVLFRNDPSMDITVVDMLPKIGMTMYPAIYDDVMKQMDGKALTLCPGHMLKAITDTGVTVTNTTDGTDAFIPADNVILAMGTRANKDAISAFEAAFDRVVLIGQTAKNPGRIATSMFDGYVTARGYEPGI